MNKLLLNHRYREVNVGKLYISTQPSRIKDLRLDEIDEGETASDFNWKAKSRRLQARRWRKIKHQVA